jgi:hypothetical protein
MTTDTTEPSSPASPAPLPKKNLFERIAGVLFAPADAFAEIARRPGAMAPLILFILAGYASTFIVVPRLDVGAITSAQQDAIRKKNPNVSEADLDRMARIATASTKVIAWASPFLLVVVYVIVAAVLLLAFRLMGGEGTFHQALTATLYAWIPLLILSIITTVVIFARGAFDPTTAATLVKSNPSFLVDMKEQPVLFSLLSSLDVFTIWTLVLLTFGFAALSRMARSSAAAIVFSLWIALVLAKVGFAALTSPGS